MDAYVLDENNYKDYAAGYESNYAVHKTVFSSEPREFNLPEGDWYVVCDNRQSIGVEKEVVLSFG